MAQRIIDSGNLIQYFLACRIRVRFVESIPRYAYFAQVDSAIYVTLRDPSKVIQRVNLIRRE